MKTFSLLPWLVAIMAGYAAMPALNVFKVDAWGAGTLHVIPRLAKAIRVPRDVARQLLAWFRSLWTPRLAFACGAVLLALLVAHLSAGHPHASVLFATVPAVAPATSSLTDQRATLLGEAAALRQADGKFKDDAARALFDAKMAHVESLDAQIRAAAATAIAPAAVTAVAPAAVPAATGAVDEAGRLAAADAERTRVVAIQQAVRVAKLDATQADKFIASGATIDQARAAIFVTLSEAGDGAGIGGGVSVGEAAEDKWLRGATNALLLRSGTAALVAKAEGVDVKTIDAGEFRGLSLLELARQTLSRRGREIGGDKMRVVADALTFRGAISQSTSDFAVLLENVMNKLLLAAYGVVPDTWSKFCITGAVSDFRAANRYRMGTFGGLDALTEKGEFKNKTITDAEKATITAATKGNIINVSRQMIVNDDLNAFTRLPQMLGRAAALSIEIDVYALLAQNGGLGPAMADGHPLFDAAHSNINGVGSALSAAGLDADRVVMASQKDKDGNEFLDLRPSVLLVPVALGGQAKVINLSQYDPDNIANKAQMRPNVVAGLFSLVIDTPRIAATRRYLFADPGIAPTLEVAFLDGQASPILETKDGWDVDGAQMKARFDYGVAAIDFRSAVTNAGA